MGLCEEAERVPVVEFEDREKSRERRGHRERYSKLENVDIYN